MAVDREQNLSRRKEYHPGLAARREWSIHLQRADGAWGEEGSSYRLDYHGYERARPTASQPAGELPGLRAAGEIDHPAVARGIKCLADTQGAHGFWNEPRSTATGFPRVFYLRYHGYS